MKPRDPVTNSCSLINKAPLHLWPSLATLVLSLIIYLATLAPTVTGEDSGELIAAAYEGGVAHPPGYPLWTMLAWLAIKLLPFGSVAYRANLLSALLASAAAAVLCRTLQRFFNIGAAFAIAGGLCLAVGRHLWSQAVIAEVYTLHVLLFCLILHVALIWRQTGHAKHLYVLALLVGLALSNHHLTVLLGPLLIGLILFTRPGILIQPRIMIPILLYLALGLACYLYLPLAASRGPYMNWGDPSSWEAFVRHITRQQYADDSMHAAHSLYRFCGHLAVLWHWNSQQYTLVALPFMAAGVVHLFRRQRDLFWLTVAPFTMHSVVLAELINFPFQRQDMFCNQVFQLPAYVITAIWLTVGAQQIARELGTWPPAYRWLRSAAGFVVPAALVILITAGNWQSNNMRHYYYAQDHADNILKSLEPQAILIPSGDHNTFPLIYRHFVDGLRPDITIADKYGYIEYELYQAMPNAPRRIRTRREREQIEAYLISQARRPVYYTVKPRLEHLAGYEAVTYGMLFRVTGPNLPSPPDTPATCCYRNLNGPGAPLDHAATVILSDYHFALAANALRAGNIAEAMPHVERAAHLSAGLKEGINNLGTLLAEFGLDQQAIRFYEQAAKLDRDYLTPRWNLDYLFKAQGNVLYAIQVFNDLARIEPEDARVFGELGFLLQRHGDLDLAIVNWGKSLGLNPRQPQILQALTQLRPGRPTPGSIEQPELESDSHAQ